MTTKTARTESGMDMDHRWMNSSVAEPTAEAAVQDQVSALDMLVAEICRDSNYESMRFVLRSNVGHDGE